MSCRFITTTVRGLEGIPFCSKEPCTCVVGGQYTKYGIPTDVTEAWEKDQGNALVASASKKLTVDEFDALKKHFKE